jgi:hypothetical protein
MGLDHTVIYGDVGNGTPYLSGAQLSLLSNRVTFPTNTSTFQFVTSSKLLCNNIYQLLKENSAVKYLKKGRGGIYDSSFTPLLVWSKMNPKD